MNDAATRREELRRAIEDRIHALFGTRPRTGDYYEDFYGDGTRFQGSDEDYKWLEETFGITEEEDVRWQLIEEDHYYGETTEERETGEPDELRPWLDDDEAVCAFLEDLKRKYESVAATYPG
ncbi:MAG: hypothetical protein K6V97_08385 [Actinomycetia bacterium]|nr:hypothetical protein [Actinomycetes bacterium]